MQKVLKNERIYSDKGKVELFADTTKLTCRTNDHPDEYIDNEDGREHGAL